MGYYFELNGYPCIDSGSLIAELDRLSSGLAALDCPTDEWEGKANSFCHQRGVDPSFGYFIVQSASLLSSGNSHSVPPYPGPFPRRTGLKILYQPLSSSKKPSKADLDNQAKDNCRVFDVYILWAKKITPANIESNGYYLVKVVDYRQSLSEQLTSRYFNRVTAFEPPEQGQSFGKFVYDHSTVIEDSSPGSNDTFFRPYTWEELFKAVWSGAIFQANPTSPTDLIIDSSIDFPDYVPQDLDWRYVTNRDALDILCKWTNTTIEWRVESTTPQTDSFGLVNRPFNNQSYRLIPIKNPQSQGSTKLDTLLTSFSGQITKNRYLKDRTKLLALGEQSSAYDPGSPLPRLWKFYSRNLIRTGIDDEYNITGLSSLNGIGGDKAIDSARYSYQDLIIPVTTPASGSQLPPNQSLDEAARDFLERMDTVFHLQFPFQEITYAGVILTPPSDPKKSYQTPEREALLQPSGFIDRVVWFDLGGAARTLITSIRPYKWLARPELLPLESPPFLEGEARDFIPCQKRGTVRVSTGTGVNDYKDYEALNWTGHPIWKGSKCYLSPSGNEIISSDAASLVAATKPSSSANISNPIFYTSFAVGAKFHFDLNDKDGNSVLSKFTISDPAGLLSLSGITTRVIFATGGDDETNYLYVVNAESVGGGGSTGPTLIDITNFVDGGISTPRNPGSTTVTILRARAASDVRALDPIVNFTGAVSLVGTSAVTSGSADNEFDVPFIKGEQILLIQKAGVTFAAIKVVSQILLGTVAAPGRESGNVTEFDVTVNEVLRGDAVEPVTVKASNRSGIGWETGERVYLIPGNDGFWIPFKIQQVPKIILGKTSTLVTENDPIITLTSDKHIVSGVPPAFPLQVRNLFKFNIPAGGWVEAKYSITPFDAPGPLRWYASQADCDLPSQT